uniref:Uncharacterized protein n=1 Tax=Pararge aegeria TaxID=116150 RepID=S4P7M8_9NEOP
MSVYPAVYPRLNEKTTSPFLLICNMAFVLKIIHQEISTKVLRRLTFHEPQMHDFFLQITVPISMTTAP